MTQGRKYGRCFCCALTYIIQLGAALTSYEERCGGPSVLCNYPADRNHSEDDMTTKGQVTILKPDATFWELCPGSKADFHRATDRSVGYYTCRRKEVAWASIQL
jgi:hypothetical protein